MININMIAERRARKMREVTTLRFAALGVLLVLLFSILLNVEKVFECRTARSQRDDAKDQLAKLQTERTKLQGVLDEIGEKKPVVRLLEQVRVSEGAWMTILADTSRITPSDVVINSFSTTATAEGINLHISGNARDEQTVGAFMLAMRQQTLWAKTPSLGSVAALDDSNKGKIVRFDLTVPVRDLMGGEL